MNPPYNEYIPVKIIYNKKWKRKSRLNGQFLTVPTALW
jgi:hypothetical protein